MPRHYYDVYCTNLKNIKSLEEYEPMFDYIRLSGSTCGLSVSDCLVQIENRRYQFSTPIITFYKTHNFFDEKIIINIHTKEIIYDDFSECDYRYKQEFIYFVKKHYALLMGYWHSGDLLWYQNIRNMMEYGKNFFLTKEEIDAIWIDDLNHGTNVKDINLLIEHQPSYKFFIEFNRTFNLSFTNGWVLLQSKPFNKDIPIITFIEYGDCCSNKLVINIETKEIIFDNFSEIDYRFKEEFIYFVNKHYDSLIEFWNSNDLTWYDDEQNLSKYLLKMYLTREEKNVIWS